MKKLLASLRSDLPASIFVFLVALPLCLGIALGSEAPLFSGVIAGIVGGIVVGIISKSCLSVSGPAAGLTTIVAAAITELPMYEAFLLAVVLAGAFQILFGLLKLGMLVEYVPASVIKGMLAAIGITLILKQIPHLVGDDNVFVGDESFRQQDGQNTFTELIRAVEHITPGAMIIGVCSLLIMLLWETKSMKKMAWTKWLPAPLIVVFGAVAVNEMFRLNASPLLIQGGHLVAIPEAQDAREFLSFFTLPDFTFLNHTGVWISAVTLAVVASLESLLGIEAVDKLDPKKRVTPPNRELLAQGAGNVVSGCLGGLPVTSVVVRSSANVTAGADSKISTIFHGLLLLVSVAFIPGVLNLIPLSALAGVLIFVGYKLTKPSIVIELFRRGTAQFVPFAVTVVAILRTDLLIGIGIGLLVGLYFVLKQNFRKAVVMVNDGDRYLIKFRPEVSFLNKPVLKSYLAAIPAGSIVYIDTTRCRFIDSDINEMIEDFSTTSHTREIRLEWRKPIVNE